MAAFSDQFQRFEPLSFQGFGPLGEAASIMASRVRRYFEIGRTSEEVTALAHAVDEVLRDGATNQNGRQTNSNTEIDIISALVEKRTQWVYRTSVSAAYYEPLAAYALWRLVDFCDECAAAQSQGWPSDSLAIATANASLAAASSAIELCAACEGWAKGKIQNILTDVDAKSEAGRQRSRHKWADRDNHRAYALEIASTIKAKFKSDVARRLVRIIREQFGINYTAATVTRWLSQSNWRRKI